MKIPSATPRVAITLVIALGIAFFYATYRAIDNIVAEQSRVQQQAVSPIFQLVRDELLRPLYIAETFASSIHFTTTMDSDALDEAALLSRLKKMESDLGMVFFVASEETRKQYFSNGTTLDLIEGDVAWYFEAIENGADFMADLGEVGNVHLFFDVKIVGPNGEFLGYVGVGKPVQGFLDTFSYYQAQYNYEFLFVNDKNEIILTSLPELVVTDAYIPTLESTEWFDEQHAGRRTNDSEIIEIDDEEFLISEYPIEELGWRLLLFVPLEARQAQTASSFVANALAALFMVTLMASTLLFLMLLYKRNIEKKTEIDALTGLPNRSFAQRRYAELSRSGKNLCVILVDLDHFKSINDTHGHDTGDRALVLVADTLMLGLGDTDVVSRWGGEEFVMLIPAESIERGRQVAEQARHNLENLEIQFAGARMSVTASFGVSFGCAADESLPELLNKADEMLYQAKQDGRNRVNLYQAA